MRLDEAQRGMLQEADRRLREVLREVILPYGEYAARRELSDRDRAIIEHVGKARGKLLELTR